MPEADCLAEDLATWDERSAADVAASYLRHADAPGFVADLLALARDPAVQAGATWLLKRHRERGLLEDSVAEELLGGLDRLEHWAARLHVLQLLPDLPIPRSRKAGVVEFLLESIDSPRTFVRAWAYGGLVTVARRFPEEAPRLTPLIEEARRHEAPSVKARLRNA